MRTPEAHYYGVKNGNGFHKKVKGLNLISGKIVDNLFT